jgi:hypothetical protein
VIRMFVHVAVLSTLLAFTGLRAVPAAAQARSKDVSTAAAPPSNITVDALLQPVVVSLLEKSHTFRRQWQCIEQSARMRVTIRTASDLRETPTVRARSQVSRYAYGAIRAIVELPVVVDVTELLPHEFEHLLEQLEGIDLAALVQRGDPGVELTPGGAYETARAQRAGRAALQEVYGEIDPAFRAAARGLKRAWLALTGDRGTAAAAAKTAAPTPVGSPPSLPPAAPQPHKQQ